ncbi:MAG TPA: hypothetical protein VHW23_11890 [Kofleriaceae bacterium]|jgi:hypothetical protein|nr:hypothetical protein [Kofleriaceae bacterium]
MNRPVIAVILAGFATGITLAFATGLVGCSGSGSEMVCEDDHCACPLEAPCSHDCSVGGNACEVQCAPGEPCSVGCAAGEHCHVECNQAASCAVDCGASPDCQVTCPASGCTVQRCAGPACQVTCGTVGLPSHSGDTARCP